MKKAQKAKKKHDLPVLLGGGIIHLAKIEQFPTLAEAEAYIESIEDDVLAMADVLTEKVNAKDRAILSALFNVYKLIKAVSALGDEDLFVVYKGMLRPVLEQMEGKSPL